LTRAHLPHTITIMAKEITIDAAGRLVIPKRFRDRLNLRPGARLHVAEEEGRLILTPDLPEARLVERDGFLVLELPGEVTPEVRTGMGGEDRLRRLVDYALLR
jgi:AbrB family looped-hinge helix DNA binding protein